LVNHLRLYNKTNLLYVMKIISIHKNDSELVTLAASNNRKAQQALYEKFSPRMLSVCRRYFSNIHEAEDAMIKSFLKVFINLKNYENTGSFEGWIKRIVVNECIDQLRKSKIETTEFPDYFVEQSYLDIDNTYELEQIQYYIDKLPTGCKMVFNLYVVEGYKHQEISEMLHISIGTSKSQLSYARNQLTQALSNLNVKENETA